MIETGFAWCLAAKLATSIEFFFNDIVVLMVLVILIQKLKLQGSLLCCCVLQLGIRIVSLNGLHTIIIYQLDL
jgi:hypothetical protein